MTSSLLEYYRETLSYAGAEITLAANGPETLEAMASHPERFDLVLTDLGLPGMDGRQLIAQTREIDRAIPIVLCTGNDEPLEPGSRERLAIAEVLTKPVVLPELVEAIARALDDPATH
ncbi:response regulator [Thiorhodococcus minor]|uniref:Response regulator n=1 Tax=Thiorhodococcus minor TaxID=57489 RepID=A0A6M0K1Z2_9GAMM|nr:response regulator [Thiorhodococcus minor]NEV63399.1 response regulator [Thiorhodococcus minor]